MKKGIIIGLIVLVGGALLIIPLLKKDDPEVVVQTIDPVKFSSPNNIGGAINESVKVEIEIVSDDVVKLALTLDGEELKEWKNPKGIVAHSIDLKDFGLGIKNIQISSKSSDGSTFSDGKQLLIRSDIKPKSTNVKIVQTFVHKTDSYTQGLEFYKGELYEGTGDPGSMGKSLIAKVDLATGEHLQSKGFNAPAGQAAPFGEGITILNDELFQVTWQNNRCFLYDVNDFSLKKEFNYAGEGWGLCNDGKSLIMSDGSERITFRNPSTFEIERTIDVCDDQGIIAYLNELEYMDGKIYANVYQTNFVMVIDPESGKVLERINAAEVTRQGRGNGEVLNGIAHDDQTGKIYMTGKFWPKLLEVKFE